MEFTSNMGKKEKLNISQAHSVPKEWEQEIKMILQGFDFCMYPKTSLEINDAGV